MEGRHCWRFIRGMGLCPWHKWSHHPTGRDHWSSFKMGKRRPRAETQGHTARNKWRSQDSDLDVTGSEACALNHVMWSLPPPLSVCVSAMLTLDPGDNHSSRFSASPKCHRCAWSAGRTGRARWQCSPKPVCVPCPLRGIAYLLFFFKITGVGKLPPEFSSMS